MGRHEVQLERVNPSPCPTHSARESEWAKTEACMANTRANARINEKEKVDQEVPLQVPPQAHPQVPTNPIGENVTHVELGRISKYWMKP
uniref:Uncharacterized protein n=1 Tax=Solanum tuberosum TaxID=4113 RepID=M1DQB7_SOLTU